MADNGNRRGGGGARGRGRGRGRGKGGGKGSGPPPPGKSHQQKQHYSPQDSAHLRSDIPAGEGSSRNRRSQATGVQCKGQPPPKHAQHSGTTVPPVVSGPKTNPWSKSSLATGTTVRGKGTSSEPTRSKNNVPRPLDPQDIYTTPPQTIEETRYKTPERADYSQLTPPTSVKGSGSPSSPTASRSTLLLDDTPPTPRSHGSDDQSIDGMLTPPSLPSSDSSPKSSGSGRIKPNDYDPPCRPGFGHKGRTIRLFANHFRVNFKADSLIYHYDVTLVPGKCPSRINREIIHNLQQKHSKALENCKLAFDGKKNLYTSRPLPSVTGETPLKLKVSFTPSDEQKEREFEVHLKLVARVSLNVLGETLGLLSTSRSEDHQKAIQALDIITRCTSSMNFVTVGRSFFSRLDIGGDLGQGRQTWFGRYQSVRPSQWGIVLNVDVSSTAFYKAQTVLEFMCEVLSENSRHGGSYRGSGQHNQRGGATARGRGGGQQYQRGGATARGRGQQYEGGGATGMDIPKQLSHYQHETFKNEIKGLRVKVTHLDYPRKYKVKGVTNESADSKCFDCEGKSVTVADYFKKNYKALRYPGLPCLHMEGKNQTIFIPIECCEIPEQNCNRKLTSDQTAAMIRSAALPPDRRKEKILGKLREARFEGDDVSKDFGVKIYNEMASIEGRVLDPPKIKYLDNRTVTPSGGQWDNRREKFLRGVEIHNWVITHPERFDCRNFVDLFCGAGSNNGIKIKSKPQIYEWKRRDKTESVFRDLIQRNPDLIVVILDHYISYNEVKRVADNHLGVVTQCVKRKTAEKANMGTLSNICLKVNMKLGGVNSVIPDYERSPMFHNECVIIFGADVTHPAPGDSESPSIAAVTASMDEYFMEYCAVAKILRHRQEVMDEEQLTPIICDKLLQFYRKNGSSKPTKIIFCRDGVSEGQFKEVIVHEMAAIQKACSTLEKGYCPGITFLVVQKRHHTRLFPANLEDSGKNGNVPAGTVVDKGITHPREFDFFLCSHSGLQGTSKPCYYHVLWDDNNFTADDLQTLMYQLCHCYGRCTKSVSYPAPTYYSHHVAFRARYHLQDWKEKSSVNYSKKDLEDAIKLKDNVKDTMYFM